MKKVLTLFICENFIHFMRFFPKKWYPLSNKSVAKRVSLVDFDFGFNTSLSFWMKWISYHVRSIGLLSFCYTMEITYVMCSFFTPSMGIFGQFMNVTLLFFAWKRGIFKYVFCICEFWLTLLVIWEYTKYK